MRIDSGGVVGELHTGYEGDEKGPFSCGNCHAFVPDEAACKNPDMVRLSKRPTNEAGHVEVEAHGCCVFIHRIGIQRGKKYGR